MRRNYEKHGVEGYYQGYGADYRNLHFSAIRRILFAFLDNYWKARQAVSNTDASLACLDLAAGSGEVTEILQEWCKLRWPDTRSDPAGLSANDARVCQRPIRRNAAASLEDTRKPNLEIIACDPYTGEAYKTRTGKDCLNLSFAQIAQGGLPDNRAKFDLVICSFALHLVETSSELWALLNTLCNRTRFLVVVSPHKQPFIKDSWGFDRIDPANPFRPKEPEEDGERLELLMDRVHLRLYRSQSSLQDEE